MAASSSSSILHSPFLKPTNGPQIRPPIQIPISSKSFYLPATLCSSSSSSYHQEQEHTGGRGRSSWPNTQANTTLDMVKDRQGVWSVRQKKVVVLWDLDNKPPKGPPYQAAMALRSFAGRFGEVVDVSAYANRHAFIHLPRWVMEHRRDRRALDVLERKGLVVPDEPYVCSVCGRKCRTNLDLRRHFKQLHERERQKKLARMRSLKGKKRQRYRDRYVSGNSKYEEAAREILTPKVGYGLAGELRRAGVFVKTVEDKPQAADWALKRQMQHVMNRGIDSLLLVSDDSDFGEMLRRARASDLQTVVVGDGQALRRHADVWVSWNALEFGELDSAVDNAFFTGGAEENASRMFSTSFLDEEYEFDDDRDDEEDDNYHFGGLSISVFSEGEDILYLSSEEDEGGEDVEFFI
uniref:C2H2-type domain-containing protein n=2 Tax=Nymphaea colorata TaxID=210225 RepID=A0A5K1CDH4_9MAGN